MIGARPLLLLTERLCCRVSEVLVIVAPQLCCTVLVSPATRVAAQFPSRLRNLHALVLYAHRLTGALRLATLAAALAMHVTTSGCVVARHTVPLSCDSQRVTCRVACTGGLLLLPCPASWLSVPGCLPAPAL